MLDDLRFGFRRALRAPASSLGIVAILAVGIGATGAMVSVFDALVFRPLTLPRPDSLVAISSRTPLGFPRLTPLAAIDHLHASGLPVDGWCGWNSIFEPTGAGRRTMSAWVSLATGDCLRVLDVPPALGRGIEPGDVPYTGAGKPVAVITDRYWERMFDRDPAVLGRTLVIQNATVTVIGVMPAGFTGLSTDTSTDIIVPFNAHRRATGTPVFIGRLHPGVSAEMLQPRVQAMWPSVLEEVWPDGPTRAQTLAELSGDIDSFAGGFSILRRLYSRPAAMIAGLAGLLLLLASVNVGGLLVSRVAAHASELAVLRSLGASPLRIGRQMMAECAALVLGGCVVGVPLAYAAAARFGLLLPWGLSPWAIDLTPDHRVMGLLVALAVVLVLVISALPAWLAVRGTQMTRTERTVSRATGRWARALVVVQVAVTMVIVFTSGLIVRSLDTLLNADRGFSSERVLSVRLSPNPRGHDDLDQPAYYRALVERLAALPEVESVGFARAFGTINAELPQRPVAFTNTPDTTAGGVIEHISPNFFHTVGVPLIAGRDIRWSDLPSSPHVAIVSQSLARALAPDGNVVGRSIRVGPEPDAAPFEIVGVAGNVSLGNYRQTTVPIVYVPAVQAGQATYATVHLRTSGPPLALARAATDVVAGFGLEHVQRASTLDNMFTNSIVAERMGAAAGSAAAVIALMLSCLGLYALLAHTVARRRREIGIRVALGATAHEVSQMVVRQAIGLVIAGLVVGIPAAMGAATIVDSLLYGVTTTDRLVLAACAILLLATAIIAAARPARRASRIDPAEALRAE